MWHLWYILKCPASTYYDKFSNTQSCSIRSDILAGTWGGFWCGSRSKMSVSLKWAPRMNRVTRDIAGTSLLPWEPAYFCHDGESMSSLYDSGFSRIKNHWPSIIYPVTYITFTVYISCRRNRAFADIWLLNLRINDTYECYVKHLGNFPSIFHAAILNSIVWTDPPAVNWVCWW